MNVFPVLVLNVTEKLNVNMLHVLLCIFEKTSSKGIERVQQDDKGVIWIKLINSFFGTENDIYLCTSYIPPIDSPVYENAFSLLYEFDFYERITALYTRRYFINW